VKFKVDSTMGKTNNAQQRYQSSSSSRRPKWFHFGQEFHHKFNSLW
jgi:hypothetical protein